MKRTTLNASGEWKKKVIIGERMTMNNDIIAPLKIDTTHAAFIYSCNSAFDWIKTIFIPVSVSVSSKDNNKDAIPNNPNCVGLRIRASTAIFKKAKTRETKRAADIQEIPLIVLFVYPMR